MRPRRKGSDHPGHDYLARSGTGAIGRLISAAGVILALLTATAGARYSATAVTPLLAKAAEWTGKFFKSAVASRPLKKGLLVPSPPTLDYNFLRKTSHLTTLRNRFCTRSAWSAAVTGGPRRLPFWRACAEPARTAAPFASQPTHVRKLKTMAASSFRWTRRTDLRRSFVLLCNARSAVRTRKREFWAASFR